MTTGAELEARCIEIEKERDAAVAIITKVKEANMELDKAESNYMKVDAAFSTWDRWNRAKIAARAAMSALYAFNDNGGHS